MRGVCEPIARMFRMRCMLNDQRCLSHCLDTSPAWTGARRINARQRGDNVDTRPGETVGPSVGKGLPDEIIDELSVVHPLPERSGRKGGSISAHATATCARSAAVSQLTARK